MISLSYHYDSQIVNFSRFFMCWLCCWYFDVLQHRTMMFTHSKHRWILNEFRQTQCWILNQFRLINCEIRSHNFITIFSFHSIFSSTFTSLNFHHIAHTSTNYIFFRFSFQSWFLSISIFKRIWFIWSNII